jgi:hypothetical protein
MKTYELYTNLMLIDEFGSNDPDFEEMDVYNEEYEPAIEKFMDPKEGKVVYREGAKKLKLDYCEFDEDILPYVIAYGCNSVEEAIELANNWSRKSLTPYVEKVLAKLKMKYPELTIDLPEDPFWEFESDDDDDDDLDESCNKFNKKRGKKMKDSKITKEMLDEAIEVAEAHGYKVVDESVQPRKTKAALIREAMEVAKAHGYKVVKEDEDEPGATAETPETGVEGDGDDQEIFTIQVTKEELEAIKSILDQVEYEDDGSADAEAAAAVVSAMDNDNIYGPADE